MSAQLLWPRLSRGRAVQLALTLSTASLEQARLGARTSHRAAAPEPWGQPVTDGRIADVQARLRELADGRGWPKRLDPAGAAEVDRGWGRLLHEGMQIMPVDAADEGVWSFLALVVVPDLSLWRWPGAHRDRFIGLSQHAFGRLWWREWVLGSDMTGDVGTAAPLSEDELVALFRRRDLVANPVVARAIVRGVQRSGVEGPARLATMKRVVVDLLRLTPARCLDVLDEVELDQLVREVASGSAVSNS